VEELRIQRGRAAAPLPPSSPVEFIFNTAEAAVVLGEADPDYVQARLVDYAATIVHLLAIKNPSYHDRFVESVRKAVESVVGAQLPPFSPRSRAYELELREYLSLYAGRQGVREALRAALPWNPGGIATDVDEAEAVARLARRILYVAAKTFLHEVGLLPLVKRW